MHVFDPSIAFPDPTPKKSSLPIGEWKLQMSLHSFKLCSNYITIWVTTFWNVYYAPPSRFKGPRRCPGRGNAGSALVFLYHFWLLYAGFVYRNDNVSRIGFTHSTIESLSYWVCIYSRKINVSKLESCNSTVGTSRDQESAPELNTLYWVCILSRKINVSKLESSNSTVGTSWDQESAPELYRLYWVCIHSSKINVSKLESTYSTVVPGQIQGSYGAFMRLLRGL